MFGGNVAECGVEIFGVLGGPNPPNSEGSDDCRGNVDGFWMYRAVSGLGIWGPGNDGARNISECGDGCPPWMVFIN